VRASVRRGPSGIDYDWSDASLARGVRETDAVIHLAGEGSSTGAGARGGRQQLYSSRIETTRKLAKLCAERQAAAFLSASAIGWYGRATRRSSTSARRTRRLPREPVHRLGGGDRGRGRGRRPHCRVRVGVVLHPAGGAISKMLPFFSSASAGRSANGKQWVSWIHLADLCSIFRFLVETSTARGAFNGPLRTP
jgi:NAD dependent epimerase/dehydratase family enzyme